MVPLRKVTGDFRQLTPASPPAPGSAAATAVAHGLPASAAIAGARGKAQDRGSLLLHAALLSGIAGYVDAAGFVSLVGLFPAHLTGELVGDAIALSSGHAIGHGHAHLWAFPVFVCAVILATLVARVFRHWGLKARAALLALVTLALALFSVSDALAWLFHEGQLPMLVRGGFAVAAMGFQSALMRESLTGSCPTTVMTGNLTQVVIDVVDHVVGRVTRPLLRQNKGHVRLTPVASSLFVFALSAALGGWLARLYGSVSVALPTALAAALMLHAWREDISGRASVQPPPNSSGGIPRPVVVGPGAKASLSIDWPIEPYSIDLGLETRTKSETRLKAEPPIPEPEPEPERISATRIIGS